MSRIKGWQLLLRRKCGLSGFAGTAGFAWRETLNAMNNGSRDGAISRPHRLATLNWRYNQQPWTKPRAPNASRESTKTHTRV